MSNTATALRRKGRTPAVEYEVLGVLHAAAGPLTTHEIARRLLANPRIISVRLSRLATYGKIGRAFIHTQVSGSIGVTTSYCLWSALPKAMLPA